MDPPVTLILDYLYLGSAWNAGNLEELRSNGVTHILNVTREIDNYFPASFVYKNIRVYDEETTDLLKHFDTTYRLVRVVFTSPLKCSAASSLLSGFYFHERIVITSILKSSHLS